MLKVNLQQPQDVKKKKIQDKVRNQGGDYIKTEFGELKKNLGIMSAYLLLIGKNYFLEKMLKLSNVAKRHFKESLVTDFKKKLDLYYSPER